jgi:hypothetical protein
VKVKFKVVFAVTAALSICRISDAETTAVSLFQDGLNAARSGELEQAAKAFRNSSVQQPATGTLLDLGIVEWQRRQPGLAVVAWEQALWIDPSNKDARNNLEFARQTGQIESPELSWYEAVSTWLSARTWAWLATISLWLAAGMITLPHVLRWRKAGWHQALASLGLSIFLLTIPAHLGIFTRSQLGFVVEKNAQLLLTATHEAEPVASMTAGEPVRRVRERGDFVFVHTLRGSGWLKRNQFALVCPSDG